MTIGSCGCAGVVLASSWLGAQERDNTSIQLALRDALPRNARPKNVVLSADRTRMYWTDSAGQAWLQSRVDGRRMRIASGNISDLALSKTGEILAYTRVKSRSHDRNVWILPLDAHTGLPTGPEYRASAIQGDVPAISPDGKSVAFARDDSLGVGQGVVVAALPPRRESERSLVPMLHTGVGSIRWTPDGRSLYIGVNATVPCNPTWSCLLRRTGPEARLATIRRVNVRDGSTSVVATGQSPWPGLSPDGSIIVFADSAPVRRMVVADTSGRRLDSFVLDAGQSIEGWVNGSTLLISTPTTVQRLREYTVADHRSRLLVDRLEGLTDPVWSPDGTVISLVDCTLRCALHLFGADGSLRRVISLNTDMLDQANGVSWSPNGQWIAYTSRATNDTEQLSAVNTATGRVLRLGSTSAVVTLRWLRDSRGLIASEAESHAGDSASESRIAFRRFDLIGTVRSLDAFPRAPEEMGGLALSESTAILVRAGDDVRRVSLDRSGRDTVILPRSAAYYANPVFSRDGLWIALIASALNANDRRMNILELLHPDGSGRVTIALPFSAASNQSNLTFLPGDRQLIVVSAVATQGYAREIYRVTVATKKVKKLFEIPIDEYDLSPMAISPDGRTLLQLTLESVAPRLFSMDLSSMHSGPR